MGVLQLNRKMVIYIILSIVSISIILTQLYLFYSSGYVISGSIHLSSTGVPKIILNGSTTEGFEKIPLPSAPLPASIILHVNGELITPIVVNNSIILSVDRGSNFEIQYIPNTTISRGIVRFDYYSDYETTMYVDRNIVLLSLPKNILDSYYEGDTLVIKFMGSYTIEYTVKEGANTPPPTVEKPWYDLYGPYIFLILGIGAITSYIYLTRFRRRGRAEEIIEEFIDETDRAILDTLKDHGGELYQSELVRILGIPKTTLWRHLRRLEVLGYVQVIKEYRRNRVRLVRHYTT